jgi:hypothetical protein
MNQNNEDKTNRPSKYAIDNLDIFDNHVHDAFKYLLQGAGYKEISKNHFAPKWEDAHVINDKPFHLLPCKIMICRNRLYRNRKYVTSIKIFSTNEKGTSGGNR